MLFEVRLYYFACNFLWCLLSLDHYFREEIITEADAYRFYLERSELWDEQYNKLADWTLTELSFLVENKQIRGDEKEMLDSTAAELGDSLIFHWSSFLQMATSNMQKNYPSVDKPTWLYYCYCAFLRQVLTEFDRVLVEHSATYYRRYREYRDLFKEMETILDNERPFTGMALSVNGGMMETLRKGVDTYATRLGKEWRQAVESAARNLKLPKLLDVDGS